MSYIVKQKIHGRIYLYEVVSYWDKEKKQPRQKRKYLGPEKQIKKRNQAKKPDLKQLSALITQKCYGNILLLDEISRKTGIDELLKKTFPGLSADIISLAYYTVCSGEPFYMFPHWLAEQYIPYSRILRSKEISSVCEEIGISQKYVSDFFSRWINSQHISGAVYYDITSVSSYSGNNNFVEWGYNRDRENLPQVNIGLMNSGTSGLPLFYQVYPGSIVDVTTLKNSLQHMNAYGVKKTVLVLDRGFCSKKNILEMADNADSTEFIQPLTFSLKSVRELIKKHRNELKHPQTSFKYNNEVLNYKEVVFRLGNRSFRAHIYYNEKADVECKHNFLGRILDIEKTVSSEKFSSVGEYLKYRNYSIPEKYAQFFKLNKKKMVIERNRRTISGYLLTGGYFVVLTNSPDLKKDILLNYYRDRDSVEKLFEMKKGCMDGKRLRAHSRYNADGRIFIKFISLIFYSYISKIMTDKKLFKKYSVKEMMAELSKMKHIKIDDENKVISEISKAQKTIFKAFDINFLNENT